MKNTPDSFEDHMRNALEQPESTPNENAVWNQIKSRQKYRNIRLKTSYYGLRIVPFLLLIASAIGYWQYSSTKTAEGYGSTVGSQQIQSSNSIKIDAYGLENAGKLTELTTSENRTTPKGSWHRSRVNKVPYTENTFFAEEGYHYKSTKTGTEIHIPAMALVHADGRTVTGPVTLRFWEYRSLMSLAACDLPMHYTDERGQFMFNTGGMFETIMMQGEERLSLAKGQSYDIKFTPTHRLTDASLYYFNESTNQWEYTDQQPFSGQKERPEPVSELTAISENRKQFSINCLPVENFNYNHMSTSTVVRQGVRAGYELATNAKKLPKWFTQNLEIGSDRLLDGAEKGNIQIVGHTDDQQMFFPNDMNGKFTELVALKGCYFRRENDEFKGTFLGPLKDSVGDYFSGSWERISVVQEKGSRCYVSLFGSKGLMQFYADLLPVAQNKNFDADRIMDAYRRIRDERQQGFKKMIEDWRFFLFTAQAFQEPDEWCLDDEQWIVYFEANFPLMKTRYEALMAQGLADDDAKAAACWSNWEKKRRDLTKKYGNTARVPAGYKANSAFTYSMKLSRFGTFNCDQIYKLGTSDYVLTNYKDENGKNIVPRQVNVMEKASRLFFTMPEVNRLTSAPGRGFDIIVTDFSGKQYLFSRKKYVDMKFKSDKTNTLVMEEVTDRAKKPEDWIRLLEL